MFTNHFLGLRGVSFHVNGRVQAGGPAHQQQGQYGGLQAGAAVPRIDVFRNEVVITAKNRRVNVLAYDALDRQTTEMMDRALIVRHKKIFIQMMQDELGVKVLSHLKDYDPELEISASVSIFEKNIEELLPELTLRRTE